MDNEQVRKEFTMDLGWFLHSILRKGVDDKHAIKAWNAIHKMDDGVWATVLNLTYESLIKAGWKIERPEK